MCTAAAVVKVAKGRIYITEQVHPRGKIRNERRYRASLGARRNAGRRCVGENRQTKNILILLFSFGCFIDTQKIINRNTISALFNITAAVMDWWWFAAKAQHNFFYFIR
jgi:hypothetical protein